MNRWAGAAALVALQLLLLLPLYSGWPDTFLQDEAYVVLGARRMLEGELPYRDWFSYLSPGSYCVSVPWMALLGSGQLGTRSLMVLISALQGLVVWQLTAPLSRAWRALAWLLWATLGIMEIPILNYHWFSLLWYSLATLAARSWVGGSQRAAVATGVLVALAGWTLQSEGLAGVLLLVVTWAVFRPPGLLRALLGLLIASLVLWGPFLPWLPQIWQQSVLSLADHLDWAHFPYSWSELTPTWEAARASSPVADPLGFSYAWLLFALRTLKYGAVPLLVLASLAQGWRTKNRDLQRLVLSLVVLGWANRNRQTLHYLGYLLPLAFPLLVHLLASLPKGRWLRDGLAVLTLLFALLGGLLWLRDCRVPIDTPSGRYWSTEPYQQKLYSILGRWATRCAQDPGGALCLMYQPSLYQLWYVRNPIGPMALVPYQTRPETVREVARQLDAQATPWILFVPLPPEAIAFEHPRVDAREFDRLQHEFYQILTEHYQVVENADVLQLLHRR